MINSFLSFVDVNTSSLFPFNTFKSYYISFSGLKGSIFPLKIETC